MNRENDMLTTEQYKLAQQKAQSYFAKAHIFLTEKEIKNIEVADFNLGRLETIGLELLTYINTDSVCAKELVLFPGQICPEHRHPTIQGNPGKEETFRCRWGLVYLYVPGEPTPNPRATIPENKKNTFTVWHEIILHPGDQYTLLPNTLHWFQGGPDGAIVSEFSTTSRDESDIFTDSTIQRETQLSK